MANRQWTTHDEDRILGAGPPSNRLLHYKLRELFYNTIIVCVCFDEDLKFSYTYLTRFADGVWYLVVDEECYRDFHPPRPLR